MNLNDMFVLLSKANKNFTDYFNEHRLNLHTHQLFLNYLMFENEKYQDFIYHKKSPITKRLLSDSGNHKLKPILK